MLCFLDTGCRVVGQILFFFLSYTPSAICSLHGCCIIQIPSGRSRYLIKLHSNFTRARYILTLVTRAGAKSLLAAIIKDFMYVVRNLSCSTFNDGMQNRSVCNVHKGEHQFEGNL
ncbi:hypothetical protein MKW98_013364 [Papaver atlanticum]|uniref:Uncharacterized protein n=1 Tax=Papaver atlanticum TaxID=357466 RepID=A0AAD4SSS2_9MAGN|nr:hypothetical protein MKW98_013364 [Papaver atlanticum]